MFVSLNQMSKNTFSVDLEKLSAEERETFFNLLIKASPINNNENTKSEEAANE